jgi:hypothetical protein
MELLLTPRPTPSGLFVGKTYAQLDYTDKACRDHHKRAGMILCLVRLSFLEDRIEIQAGDDSDALEMAEAVGFRATETIPLIKALGARKQLIAM